MLGVGSFEFACPFGSWISIEPTGVSNHVNIFCESQLMDSVFTCKHFPCSDAVLVWAVLCRGIGDCPCHSAVFTLLGTDTTPDTSKQHLCVTTSPWGSRYCCEPSIPHFPMSLQWIYSSHISSASFLLLTVSQYILISRTLDALCLSHKVAFYLAVCVFWKTPVTFFKIWLTSYLCFTICVSLTAALLDWREAKRL